MFDWLVETFHTYPYMGVAVVFLFCGAGLPLPEEIVLVAAGFVCYEFPDRASTGWMMVASALGILAGDTVPYLLGRIFGTRILRLRYLRIWVTRRRLVSFDRWFRRRGDLVIFIARFLTGIRMVAFFTAGTQKMAWGRFLLLDGLGIIVLVPPLVLLGYLAGGYIEQAVALVRGIETGILIGAGLGIASLGLWYWLRVRGRLKLALGEPADTYVEPTIAPVKPPSDYPDDEASTIESKQS